MKNSRTIVIGIMAILFGFSLLPSNSFAGPAVTGTVTIGNTPLPVQGSVNIINSPTTPLNVRDVDKAARDFFGQPLSCTLNNSSSCQADAFVVPQGKIAVVEDFSGTCTTSNNAPILVGLGVSSEPFPFTPLSVPVSLPANQTGSPITWQFGRTVRLYAPAGSTVTLHVFIGQPISNGDRCDAHISGYFMNQ